VWPDATEDQFSAYFFRDNGGSPELTPDAVEGNLYTYQDAAGPLDTIWVYWVPQCSLTVSAGEKFYVGFENNYPPCPTGGSEAICLDAASEYYWVYDKSAGEWLIDNYFGDPFIRVSMTYTAPTPVPTPYCPANEFSSAPALAIPDNGCGTSIYAEDVINVTTTGLVGKITVKLNITHTYDGDIDAWLVAPDGTTTVELFTDVGGTGENFVGTVLDDDAFLPIIYGLAPFSGAYQPEGMLSDFVGVEASGNWTLRLCDAYSGDTGTLNDWSICVEIGAPTPTSTPNGPIPATSPVGLGILVLALSAILGMRKFRK
jgi:subtilisin-like proprotein convertase family protein